MTCFFANIDCYLLLQWNLFIPVTFGPKKFIKQVGVTLFTDDTFGDFYNGQFKQMTLLSDLIREVLL